MEKTIYICDRCGDEFTAARDLDTIYIPYDFAPYGLVKKTVELCHNCQIKWAQIGKHYLAESEGNE